MPEPVRPQQPEPQPEQLQQPEPEQEQYEPQQDYFEPQPEPEPEPEPQHQPPPHVPERRSPARPDRRQRQQPHWPERRSATRPDRRQRPPEALDFPQVNPFQDEETAPPDFQDEQPNVVPQEAVEAQEAGNQVPEDQLLPDDTEIHLEEDFLFEDEPENPDGDAEPEEIWSASKQEDPREPAGIDLASLEDEDPELEPVDVQDQPQAGDLETSDGDDDDIPEGIPELPDDYDLSIPDSFLETGAGEPAASETGPAPADVDSAEVSAGETDYETGDAPISPEEEALLHRGWADDDAQTEPEPASAPRELAGEGAGEYAPYPTNWHSNEGPVDEPQESAAAAPAPSPRRNGRNRTPSPQTLAELRKPKIKGPVPPEKSLGLIEYLMSLTESLPDSIGREFEASGQKARMQHIRDELANRAQESRKRLSVRAEQIQKREASSAKPAPAESGAGKQAPRKSSGTKAGLDTTEGVGQAFSLLTNMTKMLPDKESQAVKNRLKNIYEKMAAIRKREGLDI